MFDSSFSRVMPNFKLGMGQYSEDAGKLDDFIKKNHSHITVSHRNIGFNGSQIARLHESGRFLIVAGDQLVKILVREIVTMSNVATVKNLHESGMVVRLFYLTISESKRNEFVDSLDSLKEKDHNVTRAFTFGAATFGRVPHSAAALPPKRNDSAYLAKVLKQADGSQGAAEALGKLLAEGKDVYDRVSPNLGTGNQVWEKYNGGCGQDIQKLITEYAK